MVYRQRCQGWLLGEELLESVVVWELTVFPLVCGIFICFRRVILGKVLDGKDTSSADFNTPLL